jgi:hypothetical protein
MRKWDTSSKHYPDGVKTVTQEYRQWASMRTRCKVGGYKQKDSLAYIGVSCSEEFSNFDLWLKWAYQQVGFNNLDERGIRWSLDKDYLGYKYYSAETCVFVPIELNNFLIKSTQGRKGLPTGVTHDTSPGRDRYLARCNIKGKQRKVGQSNTPEGAFAIYKSHKEQEANRLADKYDGLVDPRVINALRNYVAS